MGWCSCLSPLFEMIFYATIAKKTVFVISKSCVKLSYVRPWKHCITDLWTEIVNINLIWISFSVRTTFFSRQYVLSASFFWKLTERAQLSNRETNGDNWEQNKDKLRTAMKYDMLINISLWLSRAFTMIRLIISAAPFLVFIFPFAFVQLTCSKGVIEVSVKSLQVRPCLH